MKEYRDPFVTLMFESYKEVPTDLKYMFIEKGYSRMFGGKKEAQQRMRYLYDNSETFIFAFENALCEFSLTVRRNLIKKYWEELALDLFMESGEKGKWGAVKQQFIDKIAEKEDKKEYLKLIMT